MKAAILNLPARLKQHWFLVGLLVLIPLGLTLGGSAKSAVAERLVDSLPTAWCTATILFLMSVTLDSGRLWDSLRRPWPVLTACIVNQLVIPLLALPLLLLQKSDDLKVGLLIAAAVPCTMAAASVWTRRAGGNDAVSLLVTLLTNGLCFLVTPAWLSFGTRWFGTVGPDNGLQFGTMVASLTLAALIPAATGQLLRLSRRARLFVDQKKSCLSTLAQCIILTLVFVSAFRGGRKFGADTMSADQLRHSEFALVWACCIGLHLAAMLVAWWTTGLTRFTTDDRFACVIAGSQKTLPIGILVSQSTGMPFSLMPMLMYHASQLFIDTWIADRMKASLVKVDYENT
ncbi:MAG: bile acid:sodium symporter [Planctomycetaceae bacterium]|nr:bile acid:sodium symporter [Planctomycetaceae bacterium]